MDEAKKPLFVRLAQNLITYVDDTSEVTELTKTEVASVIFTYAEQNLGPEKIVELYDLIGLRGAEAIKEHK